MEEVTPAPRRRSARNSKSCLFCIRRVSVGSFSLEKEVAGAEGCALLQKQLESFFVFRKILDMPSDMCAQFITKHQHNLDRMKSSSFGFYVHTCSECDKLVEKCWDLHQAILSLQTQMDEIKKKLKQKIITSAKDSKTSAQRSTVIIKEARQFVLDSTGNADTHSATNSEVNEVDPGEEEDDADLNVVFDDIRDGDDDTSCNEDNYSSSPVRRRPKKVSEKKTKTSVKYPFKCDICRSKFQTEEDSKSHAEAHDRNKLANGELDCPLCKFPCSSEENLKEHQLSKHSAHTRGTNEAVHRCTECKFRTKRYYKMELHIMEKHQQDSTKNIEYGAASLECEVCHHKLANVNTYSRHKRAMHPELFGGRVEQLLECDECHQRFDNAVLYEQHVQRHRFNKEVSLDFTCEKCGKGFHQQSRLKAHMISHSEDRPWICSICGIDYPRKYSLGQHYQRNHPGEEPFAMSTPVSTKDNNQKNATKEYTCPKCQKTMPKCFKRRHAKQHLQEDGGGFNCDQCDKVYTTLQGVSQHKKYIHSGNQKDHRCPYCFKAFIHSDYISGHLRYCKMKSSVKNDAESEPT